TPNPPTINSSARKSGCPAKPITPIQTMARPGPNHTIQCVLQRSPQQANSGWLTDADACQAAYRAVNPQGLSENVSFKRGHNGVSSWAVVSTSMWIKARQMRERNFKAGDSETSASVPMANPGR